MPENSRLVISGLIGGAVAAALLPALALAAPCAAWRALSGTVASGEDALVQPRRRPGRTRRVRRAEIARAGCNPWLRYRRLEPREGPKFRYSDGMSGLTGFQARIGDGLKASGAA